MRRYMCGSPPEFCSGATTIVNTGLGKVTHTHTSPVEAFKCYKRYLINVLGYEQLGAREFKTPDGVLVLTKQSKFGAALRGGKKPEKGSKANRATPYHTGAGVIV